MCNSRVDTIDKEMLDYMGKSGCWVISFGIESGSQKILDLCKKGIKITQIEKAISLCKSSNILTLGHFIFGLLGENEGTLKKTFKFSKSLGLDFAFYYIATPFPGSELYERIKPKTNDWNKYDLSNQLALNIGMDLNNIQKKATKDFYLKNFSLSRIVRLIKVLGIKNFINIIKSGLNLIYILLISKTKK